jgi:hypothetical protein
MSKISKEEFLKLKGKNIAIKFVNDGEDIKAKFVCCSPEDVTYEEVKGEAINADPIRIKLVSYDEDIKIKLRTNNGEMKFIVK